MADTTMMTTNASERPVLAIRLAFKQAVELARGQPNVHDELTALLSTTTTLDDVVDLVRETQVRYETKSNGKLRKLLGKVAGGVLSYGTVLDMLAQHHPEYTSIAWGTFKLVFILFQNHDEMVNELAKSLEDIVDILPRTSSYLSIYANDDDLLAMAVELNLLLVEHLQAMLAFYEESRLKHALKSIIPHSIRFKPLCDKISRVSTRMDKRVNVNLHKAFQELQQGQQDFHLDFTKRMDSLDENTLHSTSMIQSIHANTSLLPSMSQGQRRLEYSMIVQMISEHDFDSPHDVLAHHIAAHRGQAARLRNALLKIGGLAMLQKWASQTQSSMLLLQGSLPTRWETQAVGVHMVQHLVDNEMPVLWLLSRSGQDATKQQMSVSQVLKYLLKQALQHSVRSFQEVELSSGDTLQAMSSQDWEKILLLSLIGLDQVFLVIDLDAVLDDVIPQLFESLARMVGHESQECSTIIRVALINQRRRKAMPTVLTDVIDLDAILRVKHHHKQVLRPGRLKHFSFVEKKLKPESAQDQQALSSNDMNLISEDQV